MARMAQFLAATIGLVALAACGRSEARGAGPATTKTFPVGNFTSIDVGGPYAVKVVTGGKPGVRASGPTNILDEMVVEVDRGTLKIHPKKRNSSWIRWDRSGPVKVEVSAAALTGAAVSGSGDMAIDRISGDKFAASIAGSGSLDLQALAVRSLNLAVAGSGDVSAKGSAGRASHSITGSGNIRTPALLTQDLNVSIAGSGNIEANAVRTAAISIMGSGDARITGGAKCSVSKMGSGSANCS